MFIFGSITCRTITFNHVKLWMITLYITARYCIKCLVYYFARLLDI